MLGNRRLEGLGIEAPNAVVVAVPDLHRVLGVNEAAESMAVGVGNAGGVCALCEEVGVGVGVEPPGALEGKWRGKGIEGGRSEVGRGHGVIVARGRMMCQGLRVLNLYVR